MRYTISDCYQYGKSKLAGCNLNPTDADFLLPIALGIDKKSIYPNMLITPKKYKKFCKLIRLRCKRMSMDKLIGYTEFMDNIIPFSPHTLTPRQETEILVDMIISDNKSRYNLKVLDLCTGSGCIGIAVAKRLHADVTMSDISKRAIKNAKHNARINNAKVDIVYSNMFDNIHSTFDIIISNPPYIPTKDVDALEHEVKYYDPTLALDGGEDGLDFYRIIADKAPQFLNPKGKIYLEIGIDEGDSLIEILSTNFTNISVIKDYAGIDRFIIAKKVNKDVK